MKNIHKKGNEKIIPFFVFMFVLKFIHQNFA